MTTTRPEVIAVLLAQDPLRPLMRADGTALNADETDLVLSATPAERVAVAEAMLLTRYQAAQHLRAAVIDHMIAAGISLTHARRAANTVQLHLSEIPYAELVKLTGADDAGMTSDNAQQLLGTDWVAAIARETRLLHSEVTDVLTSRTTAGTSPAHRQS